MQVLSTFANRDQAASMRDLLAEHGFDATHAVIIANQLAPEPPEAAELEVGPDAKGLTGIEEKLGKTINALLGKNNFIEGTGSEGDPTGGALLTIDVPNQAEADRAVALLTLHQAADIEINPTS